MSDAANTFVQMLVEQAVAVLTPIAVALVIALLAQIARWVQGRLGVQQWNAIQLAVNFAVLAAQQSGLANELYRTGEAKKALALDLATQFLKARGITLDLEKLSALIEASVYANFHLDWLPNVAAPVETEPVLMGLGQTKLAG
jgi:hypothetical protein